MATADTVKGWFDVHEQRPRDVLAFLGLLGVADKDRHRDNARTSSPTPMLALMKLPAALKLVRYEVGCHFLDQFAQGVQ